MNQAARRRVDAGLYVVCAVLLASCRTEPAEPLAARRVAELAERRWVEPRLSVGGAYGPCVEDCEPKRLLCEPTCLPPTAANKARHNTAAVVSSWLETAETISAEDHAAALWTLADPEGSPSHRGTSAEKAVQMLETLAEKHSGDARIHSDLAAAYLVRAQRCERPADLLRALEAVEKAVSLDPGLPAAVFNQGLIHGSLELRSTARQAWERYLGLDPSSPWSEEARELLDALRDPESWADVKPELEGLLRGEDTAALRRRIDPFRRAARRYVEEQVLPAWAEAFLSGNQADASRELAAARKIASVLAELGGDSLLLEAVKRIEALPPADQRVLAEGHRAYGGVVRRKACDPFEVAFRKLAGSPFQGWAVVKLATCRYYSEEYQQALQLLETLRQEMIADPEARRRHANLLGHVSWMIALSQTFLTHPLEALRSYEEALADFEATGERENVVNIHIRMADVLSSLGQKEGAWRHRYRALRDRDALQNTAEKAFLLIETSKAVLELKLPASALLLAVEALRIGRESKRKDILLAALLQHAQVRQRQGDPDSLRRDLEEVAQILVDEPGLEEVVSQDIVSATILELKSDARRADEPLRSAEILTQALQQISAGTYLPYQAQLLLKRAQLYRRAGMPAEATADMEASARALEAEWNKVLAARHRGEREEVWPAYFVHRREIFDLGIELLAEQGESERAFGYAERARARELLDLVSRLPSGPERDESLRPRTAAAVRAALPPGRLLIEYATLADRLLIWELRRERLQLDVREVSRARLAELVRTIDRAFSDRDASADALTALTTLRDLLLPDVKDGEEIVFIPDGPLHGVPFAALFEGRTRRYLVQDHVTSVAPSATLYLFSLRRDRELRRTAAPTALLIGDPAFDHELFTALDDLPEAIPEVRHIASYYRRYRILEGAEATKSRLLSELGKYDVVHFAGHAVPDFVSPYRSSLVLAPSGQEPGVLYAEELLMERLGRTRLVVLSACSTAGGRAIGSLTLTGLVRPLLGAGVPAVVGSLWDVKSGAASHLLDAFHRHLSRGESAAAALRQAQLEMLRGNLAQRSVTSWAPFQVIGAVSLNNESTERSLP